jgi:hypothetical protein
MQSLLARTLHTASWPTLDQINKLIERNCTERRELDAAWQAFPDEDRHALRPPPGE